MSGKTSRYSEDSGWASHRLHRLQVKKVMGGGTDARARRMVIGATTSSGGVVKQRHEGF